MSTVEARIGRAAPEDAGEIFTVQRAAYVAEAQLYGDPFIPPLVESLEQVHKALTGGVVVLKAVLDGRIVGFVRAQFSDHTCLVGRLAVAPDQQDTAVGRLLLDALEAEVSGRATACVLFTGHLSEASLRLYRSLGYSETHRERVAAHLTFVHMRKALQPADHPAPDPA
ncbi:GNAT family N-acetyltransferase [Actinomadura rupiterrae]|uniref:GNAT family N-acetyltransferase n=1 Tax=Actinomadura rupiterrae TaxID=559627 RepID=UPI0020A46D95|nr:GNAT family N-acetyltransferase [Actinomadura rupiterrae]MCP2338177.1 ribosomal protein S18 acetylase RimI-like enzyme [Actinomadura rupiterrae]